MIEINGNFSWPGPAMAQDWAASDRILKGLVIGLRKLLLLLLQDSLLLWKHQARCVMYNVIAYIIKKENVIYN